MFKATRVQMRAAHLSRATRPQRGRRKRHHSRRGRRQVEAAVDDDPEAPDPRVWIDP